MTLTTLLTRIAITAIILTLIIVFGLKKHKSLAMTFAQSFCGVLFLFSGWVKAVDPLGTAYKMEQYFTEFESTFEGTWFSFIAPLFPWLSGFSVSFSVFMIVFEIVLGLMLLIGYKPKLTAWAFFLLVAFFTFLTGFTYLTGYVPQGVNFFSFGSWGPYVASNMKVTDCGCFGDFIKLVPKTSFLKDVFLLIPALYFLLRSKDMHQLLSNKIMGLLTGASLVVTLLYCLSNYVTDIPHADFRDFHVGADVKNEKEAEMNAMASVQITDWKLKNLGSGEEIILPNEVYMKQYAKYPKTEWKVLDQIKSEPSVKQTKISDFEISDTEGNDLTDQILEQNKPLFMIVSHKMYSKPKKIKEIIRDSVFTVDTLDSDKEIIVKQFDRIEEKEVTRVDQIWEEDFKKNYLETIKPLVQEAKRDGCEIIIATGGADPEMLLDFKNETGIDANYAMADDILLKTLVRSNPGIMLWKDGKILDKWHYKKLPAYKAIKKAHF